jgi:putative Holliday junction resolvase
LKDFVCELKNIDLKKLLADNSVIVGLDIGDKTVGIAVSDRRIKIASGITTILRNGSQKDFEKLKNAVDKYNVGCIIFGWPVQMNGQPGSQCEKILKFIEKMRDFFPNIPFSYWDERLSTCAVTNVLLKADVSRKKRKKVVDKSASIYILQGAIDFLNRTTV